MTIGIMKVHRVHPEDDDEDYEDEWRWMNDEWQAVSKQEGSNLDGVKGVKETGSMKW